ncbi:MAG: flagellar hook-length control protein FliK, partial [Legionella sp.]
MTVEINKATDTHLSVAQEIKLEKPLHDFYVGQILKAVVTSANAEELMLNINGQYFKTKNSAQFSTGHLLDVRVLDNHEELVLEISNQASSKAILQAALLEALPKQAPATHLFELFSQVNSLTKIPEGVYQQIKLILNSVTTLAELPTALMHAISRSGIFFEAALLEKR